MHALEKFSRAFKLYNGIELELPKDHDLKHRDAYSVRMMLVDFASKNKKTYLDIDYNNLTIDCSVADIGTMRFNALGLSGPCFVLKTLLDNDGSEWRLGNSVPVETPADHILNLLLSTQLDLTTDSAYNDYLKTGEVPYDLDMAPSWTLAVTERFPKVKFTLREWVSKRDKLILEWLRLYTRQCKNSSVKLSIMEEYFLGILFQGPSHPIYDDHNSKCLDRYLKDIFRHKSESELIYRNVSCLVSYCKGNRYVRAINFEKAFNTYIGRQSPKDPFRSDYYLLFENVFLNLV